MKPLSWRTAGLLILALLLIAALSEHAMGRLLLGPDGHFGLWEGNIWSSEQSQRFADPYSFSHVVHGVLFYAVLWLILTLDTLRLVRFVNVAERARGLVAVLAVAGLVVGVGGAGFLATRAIGAFRSEEHTSEQSH